MRVATPNVIRKVVSTWLVKKSLVAIVRWANPAFRKFFFWREAQRSLKQQ